MIRFLRTRVDGTQEQIGTARLVNGRVVFSDLPAVLTEELQEFGILYNGKAFFPEDGQAFLDGLPAAYSGSIFRAEEVE